MGTPVTIILIIITVLISMHAWKNTLFYEKWMFNPYKSRHHGQYFRFLTSGFIHKDWGHLVFNMFTLFFLGRGVETYLGYLYDLSIPIYLGLYLSAIVISSIPSYLKHRDHEFYYSLGASGGVSALVFAFILIDPLTKLCLFGILCLPGFILGILYLLYSFQMGKKSMDNINHDAHLFGALYGAVFVIIMDPGLLMSFIEQISQYKPF
ncbi:MAG: rhomboid family intramembrane serine protease [Cyclobacteriaceae bacterium]|nr:rhomboid family intramembrane serine protease [Cyclobacteriaceae bacterium]